MSNLLPEGWSILKLKDISTLITKGTTPKKYISEGINFIKVESVTKSSELIPSKFAKIDISTHESFKRSQLHNGDILFSIAGSLGRLAVINSSHLPANTNQAFAIIRLIKHAIDPTYCAQQLKSEEIQIELKNLQTVGAQPNLSLQQVSDISVKTPPLPEQQKIAKILISVDEVIEKTQAQIDKLKDLKTGMMQELLTNGIGHTEFKDSPVGRIPADWEVKKFGDITLEHKQGYYSKDKYTLNGTYLIRITDMQSPFISFAEMPKMLISEKDKKAYKVLNGDFLFARSGAIGRYGIFDSNNEATFASYLIRFRFDLAKILNEFVGFWYESDVCQKQLGTITQGSSNININAQNIKELRIPIPALNEQKKITQTILSIVKKINCAKLKLNGLKNQKKALMQDLLTGKVRVKVDSE